MSDTHRGFREGERVQWHHGQRVWRGSVAEMARQLGAADVRVAVWRDGDRQLRYVQDANLERIFRGGGSTDEERARFRAEWDALVVQTVGEPAPVDMTGKLVRLRSARTNWRGDVFEAGSVLRVNHHTGRYCGLKPPGGTGHGIHGVPATEVELLPEEASA